MVPLPESKVQTHYKFPEFINDSTIIAEKSGMGDYARFVTINIKPAKKRPFAKPGFMLQKSCRQPKSFRYFRKTVPVHGPPIT